MSEMRLGVACGFGRAATPELVATAGRIAEERDFEAIWVPEHVVFFREHESRYPYSADGRIPGNPDGVLDPFVALTWLAAHTERVRLCTGICLVPQRNPVYTAKQVADVDFLSGGRVELGVGVGWLREEFEALDVPWEKRGARTADYIGVMRSLWCDEVSSYKGEFYQLPDCLQNPKPVQKPHPPVVFGGESDAALRRVATLGQGWYGYNVSPEQLAERLAKLDALLADEGRSRSDVRIYVAPPARFDPDLVPRYRDLGVQQLIVGLGARTEDKLAARADGVAKLLG